MKEERAAGSMDWRFLPELPASGQLLLLTGDIPGAADEELATSFTVTAMTNPAHLSDETALFDLIALPDGLNAAASLPDLAQRLKPDGAIYLSFASPWKRCWLRGSDLQGSSTTSSSLHRVRQQLLQAGLQPVAVYGALPNHLHPIYLFPLTPAALQFVFRQILSPKFIRLRRRAANGTALAGRTPAAHFAKLPYDVAQFAKLPTDVGRTLVGCILSHPFFLRSLAHFLPAYAVIGRIQVS